MPWRIPYELVPLVAVVWLTYQHVQEAPASDRSKHRLIVFATLSVLLAQVWPLLGTLLQVSVCLYVLLYRMVADADRELGK